MPHELINHCHCTPSLGKPFPSPCRAAILPKPPNATSTSIAQTSSVLANTFLVPLVGSPSFLQPVADKGPLWIPSETDDRVASPTAAGVCSAWGGTLAGPLGPAFQDALTTGMDKSVSVSLSAIFAFQCLPHAQLIYRIRSSDIKSLY